MPSARDVLEYLAWWDHMLWRECRRLDPTVEWQADLSWDEVAAMTGVDPPRLAPGELNVALYWPSPHPCAGDVVL